MKITKQQLKQIIKEEIENTMDEGFMDSIKGALGMGAKSPASAPSDSEKCRTIHAMYNKLKAEPPGYRSKDPAGEIDLEEWVERRKREHPECFSRDA